MMSMPIEVLSADIIEKIVKRKKDVKYIDLRPSVSENDDHHNGNIAKLNM